MFLSRHSFMSLGCFAREKLYTTYSDPFTSRMIRRIPVADALRPKKDGVVQVHVRRGPVAESLSRMEDERDVEAQLFLPHDEALEGDYEVDERRQRVFRAYEVET